MKTLFEMEGGEIVLAVFVPVFKIELVYVFILGVLCGPTVEYTRIVGEKSRNSFRKNKGVPHSSIPKPSRDPDCSPVKATVGEMARDASG